MEQRFDWIPSKNRDLKARYGFGFERIVVAIEEGSLLAERRHPNSELYPHQRQLIVFIDGYVWVVPFVSEADRAFLKRFFPSRKARKAFMGV